MELGEVFFFFFFIFFRAVFIGGEGNGGVGEVVGCVVLGHGGVEECDAFATGGLAPWTGTVYCFWILFERGFLLQLDIAGYECWVYSDLGEFGGREGWWEHDLVGFALRGVGGSWRGCDELVCLFNAAGIRADDGGYVTFGDHG